MRSTIIATSRFRLGIAFTLLLCAEPLAFAAPLGLEQAQRIAVSRSHTLAGINAAVSASRDMAVAARQLPDPVIKLGVDNLPVGGPDRFSLSNDFMTMRRLGVMQELTRSDKRERRADAYLRAADKSLAEKDAVTAAIERDTAIAWLDSYFLRELSLLAAGQTAQAENEVAASEAAYRGGKGSLADVLAARSALVMAQDRASDAARRSASAATMLARWIGAEAESPLAQLPALDTIPFDIAELGSRLAHHPQLGLLDRQVEAALAEVRSAEAARKSDWSVELAFQQRGPAYSNMVSIGVSVPLQWDRKNRQDRDVAAKAALAGQARAEREEAQRTHLAETRVMIEEWRNGRERLARFERDLQPLAAQRVVATLAAYRGGKAALTDVLAARRGETEVAVQALELRMATARLWAQLHFLFPHGAKGDAE
jgi:outer membrane protein TolC